MTPRSPWDRMKTKNFYMILVLVAVSTITLWILSSPSPNFQTIVSKTQSGIIRASNIQIREKELTVDPVYLKRLGFTADVNAQNIEETGYSESSVISTESDFVPLLKDSYGLPVIASGVKPDLFPEAVVLMNSIKSLLPHYKTVLYDLGLSASEQLLLNKHCNVSWNCETRVFKFDKYPSHVKYLNIKSYRPLCIQEMLHRYGAVIWVDDGYYFTESNLTLSLTRAKEFGLQGWPLKDPTSSFTHPKMFKFFNMDQNSYFFQHAIEASHLMVFNTEKVSKDVMLPWVKCALMEECISPPGAQDSGCNYFRKPLFKYTGCHKYDMSALNVILGIAFKFDEEPYTNREKLFGNLLDDQLRAENKTRPEYEIRWAMSRQINV
ncbi:CAunnamed protein product [Biomphalaria glabrata]|nr:CAunnamed protein product [Biomphalaria glabrata]